MNFSKGFKIVICIFALLLLFVAVKLCIYNFDIFSFKKSVQYCTDNFQTCDDNCNANVKSDDMYLPYVSPIEKADSCYCKMYSLLLPRLLVYKVKVNNNPVNFIRTSQDAFIIPDAALENADAIVSYGLIYNYGVLGVDIFEDSLSKLFKKNVYAFDCYISSADHLVKNNPFFNFEQGCLATDKYSLDNSGMYEFENKVHDLGKTLQKLNLLNKKIYLKSDTAGTEIETIPQILKYSDNLTGFSIVIRLDDTERLIWLNDLLKQVEENFVLVARNNIRGETYNGCKCKYMKREVSSAVALTYINKNLIDKKYLPFKQDYHSPDNYITVNGIYPTIPPFTIDWEVVLTEKFKNLF
ncbi:MAG: hypothetical protein K6C94_05690 [Candidatus Gastranaerophilales bacterium]|nr:hypothetical protein [Candidatus Gastranaerophilales bacterium]